MRGDEALIEIGEEDLGKFALWQAEELAFPPSQWERDTLGELLALPRVVVRRPPEAQLLAAGMLRNNCHANCAAQQAAYPHLLRHVSGWIISGPLLVLHSVIEVQGQLRCVTPQTVHSPSSFEFIPDPKIEWREASDREGMDPFRDGTQMPNGLRKYPEHHVRMRDRLRDLMAGGMSAFDAREMVDTTLGAELRRMEPI
jgi:hypothetical protein